MPNDAVPAPTVSELMAACAKDAVEIAREKFRVTLDGSFESIEQLEGILATQYHSIPRGWKRWLGRGPSDEVIQRFTFIWGGYLGEMLRQRLGGEWVMPDEGPMAGYACLNIHGMLTSPQAKVGKRLTHGAEDDLWHYARVIAHQCGEEANSEEPRNSPT